MLKKHPSFADIIKIEFKHDERIEGGDVMILNSRKFDEQNLIADIQLALSPIVPFHCAIRKSVLCVHRSIMVPQPPVR